VTAPKRIQLRRTRGWRKPEGAIVVARPGRWGNPFTITEVLRRFPSLTDEQCQNFVVNEFRDLVGWWKLDEQDTTAQRSITASLPGVPRGEPRRIVTFTYPSIDEIRTELAGADLACWCSLSEACHADVLLRIANP
jgi:hypothetical protein